VCERENESVVTVPGGDCLIDTSNYVCVRKRERQCGNMKEP